jgi:hypothetical protein
LVMKGGREEKHKRERRWGEIKSYRGGRERTDEVCRKVSLAWLRALGPGH